MPRPTRPPLPWGVADALVLLAVLALGLLHLFYPFEWDQAMFTLGARAMGDGGLLYRDVWDVKPPAIYGFYWCAGQLFGFDERGAHALELLWWLGFSAVLLGTLRGAFENRWAVRLAPLFTAGVYFAICGPWHLGQVEGLAAFPLWLSLWWAATTPGDGPPSGRRLLLSGFAGGLALLFKLVFLPIVAAFWIVAAARAARAGGSAVRALIAAAAGAALPLAAVLGAYAALGALEPLVRLTVLGLAGLYAGARGTRLGTLFDGLSWASLRYAPLAALAALGTGPWLRRGRDAIALDLVLWMALGSAVILVQRFSWWQYHWLLVLPPLGLLAAAGADAAGSALARRGAAGPLAWPARPAVAGVALLLLFSGHLTAVAAKALALARARFATTPARFESYQRSVSELYDAVHREVEFLRAPGARPGPIFVVGDPVFYRVARRAPAVPEGVGRIFEALGPADWERLAQRLERTRPAYVFVASASESLFAGRAPRAGALARLLDRESDAPRSSALGRWYALRAPAGEPPR